MKKLLEISHVNIRLSISSLVLKLLLLEILAASGVVLFMSASLSSFIQELGFELPFISIPLYVLLVAIKTFITLVIVLQWLNEYYEISPELVIHKKGILFRYEEKYPLKDVKTVHVTQSVLGRIFNYGTITLQDAYKLESLQMYQIHNPMRYASILEKILPDEVETIHELRRHIFDNEKADVSVN